MTAVPLVAGALVAVAVVLLAGDAGPVPRRTDVRPDRPKPSDISRRHGPGIPLLSPLARRLADRRRTAAEARTVEQDLPDLVDLLVLADAAGLTLVAGLPVLVRWGPPSAADPLERTAVAIARGERAADAFATLGARWGDPARPLVHALLAHLRDGTPLGEPLARAANEARLRRQRAAETRARRLPVVLLFPLVFCVLPAFGLLTVAPLVAGTLRSLSGETIEAMASSPLPPEVVPCPLSSNVSSPRSCPPRAGVSPPPSTPWCCSVPPPSPSSSWPGSAEPMPSPDSSTR